MLRSDAIFKLNIDLHRWSLVHIHLLEPGLTCQHLRDREVRRGRNVDK